ncbi:MAG: DNA polymerase I [Albidovulum sp.]|nr:DNA polymerase I [Albidovulum sp.]
MENFGNGHHLQLVDGSGFVFRAFFQAEHSLGADYRYRTDGLPVGAVHLFCNMLMKLVEDRSSPDAPTHSAVIFDTSAATFRSEIFSDYKANRPSPPEDLVPQFPLVREATRAFNFPCIELDGYEADDLIATFASRARDAGGKVTIVSSDKDLMQIVGGGVEMYDTMKNRRIGAEAVFEKFGVAPEKVVDVQALSGDSVDNIPGAPGIGPKIAALLINEYGDLESLLQRAEEIKQPKRRQTLVEKADQIRMSRKLVELRLDAPVPGSLEDLEIKSPVASDLLPFLRSMEFRTITRRAAAKFSSPDSGTLDESVESGNGYDVAKVPFDRAKYECVRSEERLAAWIERIRERGFVAVDTETTGLDEMQAELVGISLSVRPGDACYIPVAHKADDGSGESGEALSEGQIGRDVAVGLLRPVLEDDSILKIGQNIKYDLKILARYGIEISPIDDTMLMSYALYGGLHRYSMEHLSGRYLEHEPIPIKQLLGTGKSAKTFDRTEIDSATEYAAEDADITLRLWKKFRPELSRSGVSTVYHTLERPLVPVLADMERTGIKVDHSYLAEMSVRFEEQIEELGRRIHALAGRDFNIASPAQLGEILFDELGLPGGKKGKTGAYATGADILGDLASEGHEISGLVLDWRQLSKLKSTYTDALQAHIHPETGRVHTSYSIAGANTGRLASTDPNLQNIPVRTEEGRRIREAFIPDDGCVLLSLDYSQIELRILAHAAKLESLRQAFVEGQDIHALTASQMFGVPVENMDPMVRRRAKAINFGVIYGISAFGLARNLRIPRSEAKEFIDRYFERFPGIRAYMKDTVEFGKRNGYVETLFGRRIHTPMINSGGPHGAFAKRAAINAPIQGSAADVIRRAMIRIPKAIAGLPAKMLLQVHDELLFEVEESAVEDTVDAVRDVMETASLPAVEFFSPLVVESGSGRNWAEAH